MIKDDSGLYSAFKAKDARFDGRLFVGISSTGIYCRPVCRAKRPKAENCSFFPTAAEAEKEGYRPCLLCRPELAPGSSITDASATLARRAARIIEQDCGNGQNLDELALSLNCSDRHLRRVFTAEFNVSPVEYLQTCRLLLAKNLLTDTDLSVIDVAMAAGFGSLRRFNDLFKIRYRLSPTALRKRMPEEKKQSSDITFFLGYRPPYRWEEILEFLAFRSIPGVDFVYDNNYLRTAHIVTADNKHIYGWVKVGHAPKVNSLSLTVSESLLPVLPQVSGKIRQMFDLYCDPESVYEVLSSMNSIRPDFCILGTRLPGSFDTFEMISRAILGQQITVKAASTLAGRIVNKFGIQVDTGINGLTHIFPTPERILDLDGSIENHLGPLGVTAARSRTIKELARAIKNKDICFDLCSHPGEEMRKLLSIKGVGNWTAQYIAMRTMGLTDAFLETDIGIKKALAGYNPKELLKISEKWRPWRSYATINLWNSL